MAASPRDENRNVSIGAKSDITNGYVVLEANPTTKALKVDVAASTIPLPTGAATAARQDSQTTLLQGVAGFTLEGYDYIALTYVAAGNGVGEIETAVFKSGGSGGTTIATLTLAYDANNNLSSVTKS